jgi:hypothetical protein
LECFVFIPGALFGLQLALAGTIYILDASAASEKSFEEIPAERTSPIEAAEALGGFFQTAQRVFSR